MQFKIGTVYAVDSEYETYIGTYRGPINNKYFPAYMNVLWDVKMRIKNKSNKSKTKTDPILVQNVSILKNDTVYDLSKIKDTARKARESFEKRSLDQILKKLINEHFEW